MPATTSRRAHFGSFTPLLPVSRANTVLPGAVVAPGALGAARANQVRWAIRARRDAGVIRVRLVRRAPLGPPVRRGRQAHREISDRLIQ